MKNQEEPQPSTSEAMIICPNRRLERIDYKKIHMKGLDTQEKTKQVKFTKSEEYTQLSVEPTLWLQKKRWNDAMKTDLETLMNEKTHLPTLIKWVFAAEQVVFDKITPKTFKQIHRSNEKQEWITACQCKIKAHKENNTWTLVPRLKPNQDGKKHIIMKSLWWFKIKTENRVITCFKAWLCTDGSSMNWKIKADPNIEFEDNYLESTTTNSMNITYSIAAAYRFEMHSGDVLSAYVQFKMPEGDIVYYIEQPEGFKNPGKSDHVCKLNIALYGVLVAGQRWNLTFWEFLIKKLNFTYCKSDPNLYIHHESDGNFCIMPMNVDDTIDICTSPPLCEEIHTKQNKWFKWKSFGTYNWFLDCAVKQNQKEISIDQYVFFDNLLKSFEGFDIKPMNNPASTNLLTKLEDDEPKSDFPYSSLVGSLN